MAAPGPTILLPRSPVRAFSVQVPLTRPSQHPEPDALPERRLQRVETLCYVPYLTLELLERRAEPLLVHIYSSRTYMVPEKFVVASSVDSCRTTIAD